MGGGELLGEGPEGVAVGEVFGSGAGVEDETVAGLEADAEGVEEVGGAGGFKVVGLWGFHGFLGYGDLVLLLGQGQGIGIGGRKFP
ncbi:hypothetical protein ASF71_20875 [Deinococcus sp. Leaf326]|nr:hypothetical protein ASF71_20875 [Deinococcus sp. Leaf326]